MSRAEADEIGSPRPHPALADGRVLVAGPSPPSIRAGQPQRLLANFSGPMIFTGGTYGTSPVRTYVVASACVQPNISSSSTDSCRSRSSTPPADVAIRPDASWSAYSTLSMRSPRAAVALVIFSGGVVMKPPSARSWMTRKCDGTGTCVNHSVGAPSAARCRTNHWSSSSRLISRPFNSRRRKSATPSCFSASCAKRIESTSSRCFARSRCS